MYKKRLLFITEFSGLATGFSNIARSLLPRLVTTEKYEIAEMANYCNASHPEIQNFVQGRWKVYPTLPSTKEEQEEFNQFMQCSRPRAKGGNTAQFGEACFQRVLADFKPDCVISWSDWWMCEYIEISPFRDWYKWVNKPTVDSPQQDELWIQTYENTNVVLAYSDFGVHTLKSQSPKIKIFPKPMRPGVDLDTFKPMDKLALREKFNLSKEIPILGIVQRNQSRKNILDVIDSFAYMKNKHNDPQVQRAVLLLHTAWPDNMHSFDYPRHIKRLQSDKWMRFHRSGIMYDILQTLMCHDCGEVSVTFAANLYGKQVQRQVVNGKQIQAIFLPCVWCGKQTATCPTTGVGVSREQLAEIYNLMDVLVQCSIAEGDGMPSSECKACGVLAIVTDHSALSEKGRFPSEYIHFKELGTTEQNYTVNKGGMVHKVAAHRHEPETGCLRAVPDIYDLADKMKLLITDEKLRQKMSKEARECVEENYDWDKIAKQWEYVLDNIKTKDRSKTWDSPIQPVQAIEPKEIPSGLNNKQFVEWLYIEILKYPKIDPQGATMWENHLQQGVTREALLQQFVQIGKQQTDAHQRREEVRAKVAGIQSQEKQEWV